MASDFSGRSVDKTRQRAGSKARGSTRRRSTQQRANRGWEQIQLALEEFRGVRDEELVAMQTQIGILRYGITGGALLIGVAVQQHGDKYLGWAIALSLVPLILLFSAVIWMGEYERLARAGQYIALLEGRINRRGAELGWLPLGWQEWVREGGRTRSRVVGGHHRYVAVAAVFIGLHVAAVALGLHFYYHLHSHDPSRRWMIPLLTGVNLAILATILGYFRSSYERLRDYATNPHEPTRIVRQRLRMRLRLYSILAVVAVTSAPIYSWPLGIVLVSWFNHEGWLGHVALGWAAIPTLVWVGLIPLVASRAVMHELLQRRRAREASPDGQVRKALTRAGACAQLTKWERRQLRVIGSEALNAPSMGRGRKVSITTHALLDEAGLLGVVAHELGHHRLQHLHPLGLCYLYLWPYLYYDDSLRRRESQCERRLVLLMCRASRVIWTLIALPGWLAWCALRLGWRTAEYDADRFACLAGTGESLNSALAREIQRHRSWGALGWRERLGAARARVAQGRAVGYLPIPNEHPSPSRRARRIRRWLWESRPDVELESERASGTRDEDQDASAPPALGGTLDPRLV
jgi:Zn-dependent protease with chaperone function